MAVRCPVPSQESAYRYAGFDHGAARRIPLSVSSAPDIMIGGHLVAIWPICGLLAAQHDIEESCEQARNLGLSGVGRYGGRP